MREYIFLLQIMELKFSKPAFLCNFPIKRLKMERMHLFEWEDIYISVSELYFLTLYWSIHVFEWEQTSQQQDLQIEPLRTHAYTTIHDIVHTT